jgi:alpha-beta hydrolase superfamily lysophospholipase
MDADRIVILPGIHGSQTAMRSRDLALALRQTEFHALTLDQRGHGQTARRYPFKAYAWGDPGDR